MAKKKVHFEQKDGTVQMTEAQSRQDDEARAKRPAARKTTQSSKKVGVHIIDPSKPVT